MPVYWITGLSGAGKTTVATIVSAKLTERGEPNLLIDGDAMREVFGADPAGCTLPAEPSLRRDGVAAGVAAFRCGRHP